jgi:hypothetical protein
MTKAPSNEGALLHHGNMRGSVWRRKKKIINIKMKKLLKAIISRRALFPNMYIPPFYGL